MQYSYLYIKNLRQKKLLKKFFEKRISHEYISGHITKRMFKKQI